jgi:hypothetical protein
MKMLPFALLIVACGGGGDANLSTEDACEKLAVATCQNAGDCGALIDTTVSACEAAVKQYCIDDNAGSTCPESAVNACADDLAVADCDEKDSPSSCADLDRACE